MNITKIKNKIFKPRNNIYAFFLLGIIFIAFAYPQVASAAGTDVGDAVAKVLGWIASLITTVVGKLTVLLLKVLMNVAQFNHIIDVPVVQTGWVAVRDLCNMFFILILLVIAFATILRIETYSIKRTLPKLLIMAVLINFSRTIFGLIIDFSQVIMLTFINAVGGGLAANNLTNLFQIQNMNSISNASNAAATTIKVSGWSTSAGIIAGLLALLVVFVVVLAMLAMLIIRVIFLWLYTILSPLVFLGFAFAPIRSHTQKIWDKFIEEVMVGPALAFFLWLALVAAGSSADKIGQISEKGNMSQLNGGIVSIFAEHNFQKFIITIGILIGGLTISKEISSSAGAMAGKGLAAIQKGKTLGTKGLKRVSGYDAVADRTKAYMAMRKSNREDKIRQSVAPIARGVGKTKRFIGEKASYIARKPWGKISGKNKAEKLRKEIQEDKNKVNNRAEDIENKRNFTEGGFDYRHEKMTDKWEKYEKDTNNLKGEFTDDELQKDFIENPNKKIEEKEKIVKKLETRQKRINTAGKIGLAIGGATLGAATAGTGLGVLGTVAGGLYGAAIGGVGLPAAGKAIKEAGKDDLNLASNYEHRKVNEERESIKTKRPDELKRIKDDQTKNSYERMAAGLELISQKETNTSEINKMREELVAKFGDKVKGAFEGLVRKNYISAAKDMSKADIKKLLSAGAISLPDMDNDSISKYGAQISEGMKLGTFKKQYKLLPDSKKEAIKESLRKTDTYAAREFLAHVDNIDEAFKNYATEKAGFMRKLNLNNIKEILSEGKEAQRKSLRDNIGQVAPDIHEAIMADSVEGKNLRASLGIKNKPKKEEKPEPGSSPGSRAGFTH